MTISERVVGSVTILDIDGNLTLEEGAERLRGKVRSLLQQGQQHFLVTLATPYMDSAGLGELVQTFAMPTNQGGSLRLLNLTTRLHDLVVNTKLADIFDCIDDEQRRLRSFAVA
jgi:anti-anti-sigma factor